MQSISAPEIRELLKSIEKIAVRPGHVTARDLLITPALFKKLIEARTNNLIQVEILVDGSPLDIEVTE